VIFSPIDINLLLLLINNNCIVATDIMSKIENANDVMLKGKFSRVSDAVIRLVMNTMEMLHISNKEIIENCKNMLKISSQFIQNFDKSLIDKYKDIVKVILHGLIEACKGGTTSQLPQQNTPKQDSPTPNQNAGVEKTLSNMKEYLISLADKIKKKESVEEIAAVLRSFIKLLGELQSYKDNPNFKDLFTNVSELGKFFVHVYQHNVNSENSEKLENLIKNNFVTLTLLKINK